MVVQGCVSQMTTSFLFSVLLLTRFHMVLVKSSALNGEKGAIWDKSPKLIEATEPDLSG